jgi:hypothetical protein
MPVLVTNWIPPYDNDSNFINALNVTVIVQRMPILQSNDGVGIVQLVASIASLPTQQGQEMSSAPSG